MPTLHGVSDGIEAPRELHIECRGAEAYLCVRPPGNTTSGQEIVVPWAPLVEAVRAGEGRVEGRSPVRGTPKECVVERRPEGMRVQVHPASGSGSWWVVVPLAEFEAAISKAGAAADRPAAK